MPTRVLIDACILIPYQLSEFLLRLASAGMYEPVWSAEILDELHRNLIAKIGLSEEKADRRIARMQALFPYAAVDGYEAFQDLAESLGTDPKDRHVAAAALHGRADVLITNNEKDFPVAALARYGVQVVKPDDFLRDQLELDPTSPSESSNNNAPRTCVRRSPFPNSLAPSGSWRPVSSPTWWRYSRPRPTPTCHYR